MTGEPTASARASLAILSLVAAMSLTGANVPIGKAIVAVVPVEALIAVRFTLASLLLVPLATLEPGPTLVSLKPRQWAFVAALGIVGSLLFTLFLLEGVRRTSAADAGIIMATLPAVVAILGLLRGERPDARGTAMIALAILGVALIQSAKSGGQATFACNALVGLAVACEAVFVMASRSISSELPPLRLSLAVSLASLVAAGPFCFPAVAAIEWSAVPPLTWLLVAGYTVTSSILCTVLWYRGVPHVASWRAGLATAAVPVVALAGSALFLSEPVGALQMAGAGCVIAAIIVGAAPRGEE